jgi:hypothetical protein
MFEHPYFSQQLTQHDQEQMERAAARRLFLLEHADQIVPRPAGAMRRMLRRLFGRAAGRTTRSAATARSATRSTTSSRATAGCDTAAATAAATAR